MKLLRLDHIQVLVEDIAQSVAYYQRLGLVLEGTLGEGKEIFLWNGDEESPVRFELHQVEKGTKLGVDHIAFSVEDVKEGYRALHAQGVEFEDGPLFQPLTGRNVATMRDSNGVGIQLAKKVGHGEYEDSL